MSRAPLAALLLLALAQPSCKSKERRAPDPEGSTPAPPPRGVIVAGPRPPIRSTVTAGRGPGAAQVRLYLARITPADGLRLMLRFDMHAAGGPPAQYDWAKLATSLRFTIRGPSGAPRVLQIAASPTSGIVRASEGQGLVVDASGLGHWARFSPWKTPAEGLFAEPGKYTARVEGTLPLAGGDTPFTVDTPSFEVVAASASFRSAADLAARGADAVKNAVGVGVVSAPKDAALLAIDDVEDGRWLRFELPEVRSYEAHTVDVRISPAGQVIAMRDFAHFTCVAEGTRVATPAGDRPIETLSPGDAVWGYDVESGRRVATTVVAARLGVRTSLVRIGDAETTPEHPVEVGGAFIAAGSVPAGAESHDVEGRPRALPGPVPVARIAPVIDLGVAWPHTFFAGGVLVHNKAVAEPMAPGDPWDPWRGTFVRETDATPRK